MAFSKQLCVGQLIEQFIILLLVILCSLYACVYVHRISNLSNIIFKMGNNDKIVDFRITELFVFYEKKVSAIILLDNSK